MKTRNVLFMTLKIVWWQLHWCKQQWPGGNKMQVANNIVTSIMLMSARQQAIRSYQGH